MTVTIKVGTKDTIVSSYNLFFSDGLRLKTDDLMWLGTAERDKIRDQFMNVCDALRGAGWTVEGSL
jgi:hypothetical protein